MDDIGGDGWLTVGKVIACTDKRQNLSIYNYVFIKQGKQNKLEYLCPSQQCCFHVTTRLSRFRKKNNNDKLLKTINDVISHVNTT
jgi:hypothetical protein